MSILQPSFRGITFLWDDRGVEQTKRFASHDFPQKKGRWHEDMAAGPQVYTFTAWIIAPTADLARLVAVGLAQACNDQSAGVLIHPWYGVLNVVCTGFKAKEDRERLGRIDFDLTFEDDLGRQSPMSTRQVGAALAVAVTAANAGIGAALDEVWDLGQLPAYALADAGNALLLATTGLTATTYMLTTGQQAAIALQVSAIAVTPVMKCGLSVPVIAAFAAYTTDDNGNSLDLTAAQAKATYLALLALCTFTLPAEDADTNSKAVVAQAMCGLSVTIRRLALLQMANLTRLMTFVSSNDAITTRDTLSDLMLVEIITAADAASTNSDPEAAWASETLDAARCEMIADLTATAATLVPVASLTLPQTMPSDAICYALYGDGDGSAAARAETMALELDFIQRNGIQDPGVCPGGVPLEYLVEISAETG